MWSLEFASFAEDFVGYNQDDYPESVSLCDVECDELWHRCKW
jgi:hypothetical protein